MGEQVDQQPLAGKVLKEVGGFEIITKVGQGGMGAVFKARQKSLDRIVALKVLPPSIAKDKIFIERFVREARASARLSHPNVVTGIDVGQDAATSLWYFAMEFVDGPTAKQLMNEQGKLPEDQALRIAKDIAGALDCAHQHGMVHRDVKPDNILMSKNGSAKLADLGLVRQMQEDASLTQSGATLGTPFYMAPEQIRGELENLDTRADLYALGATLFHLVTGQLPFQGATSAVIMLKHLSDPPPMANRVCPEVSVGCTKLIAKLMQKDKAQRLQTPRELIEQIDRLLKLPAAARSLTTGPRVPVRGSLTTAPREAVRPKLEKEPEAPRKDRSLLYAGAGAGSVVLLGVIGFLLFSPEKPKAESNAKPSGSPAEKPALTVSGKKPDGPSATTTSVAAPKESSLERRWREAKAFAQAQPQAFDEILRRYHPLGDAAGKSPLATEIEAEIMAVEEKYDTAAQDAWKAAESKINACAASSDYDGALAALQAFAPALAARLREQIGVKQQALIEAATKKVQPALDQADAASAAADPAAGLKALESVAAVKYEPLAADVRRSKARLEDELANVDALRERKAQLEAHKKLTLILARFDAALLDNKDEAAASRAAQEAKGSPDLQPVRAQADALSAILGAYAAERKRQADALDALKGKPFTVGTDSGTIERFENGQIYVGIVMDGGKVKATKSVKLADLSEAQRNELFPKLELNDVLRVSEALRKLTRGQEDLAGAAELLDAADTFPLAKHYQDLIESRRAVAAEAEARKAWDELVTLAAQPMQKPEQAQAAYGKVTAYVSRYGKTAFVQEHADALAEMKKKIEYLACPNLLVNGDFEGGTLDGWKLERGAAEASATAAHNGKAGLLFSRAGVATQVLNLVPGQTYRFSCWVKSNAFVRVSLDGLKTGEAMRTGNAARLREWTPFTFTFTATKPDHFISLLAYSELKFEACFDDLVLARVGEAEAAVAAGGVPADAVPFGGHAYKFIAMPMTWGDARNFCQQQGGYLACVETAEETRFIARIATGRTWVGGLRSAGKWSWINGIPINEKTAPLELGGESNRIYLSLVGIRFRDTPPVLLPFVCEWDLKDAKGAPAPNLPAAAQFLAEDTHTQGNWKKFYGKDGYAIQGDETKLPAYATFSCESKLSMVEAKADDLRALLHATREGRVAAAWYEKRTPINFDLKFTDGKEHAVALYLLDWKYDKLVTRVELLDAASGAVLDTRTVRNYAQGVYLVWRIQGAVKIRVRNTDDAGRTCVNAVFFQ